MKSPARFPTVSNESFRTSSSSISDSNSTNNQTMTPPPRESPSSSSDDNEMQSVVQTESWYQQPLLILVVGASGDLAKKKTYPAIFELYRAGLLPPATAIWGFARSRKSNDDFRAHLRPYLIKLNGADPTIVDRFLDESCYYQAGKSYGDDATIVDILDRVAQEQGTIHNLLVYLAVPPNVFGESCGAVRSALVARYNKSRSGSSVHNMNIKANVGPVGSSPTSVRHLIEDPFESHAAVNISDANASNDVLPGFVRIVLEKPFGRDTASCQDLLAELRTQQWDEARQLYRIDHYLGKEMVQNLLVLRQHNPWLQAIWSHKSIEAVHIVFKEPFGCQGRGGYFDHSGIIRDVIQNHLLQVLTLIAMEMPENSTHGGEQECIRDAKVEVLRRIKPIQTEDVLLGQYVGYHDDPTIENKSTQTPTYAAVRLKVDDEGSNGRWSGVPFILEAGKALDERLCEVRIHLKRSTTSTKTLSSHRHQSTPASNALVLRIQPQPTMFLTTNIKTPGFAFAPISTHMGIHNDYCQDAPPRNNMIPDAYTRLLLDVLRGNTGSFVRDDELVAAWEIFTPLLRELEESLSSTVPSVYEEGSDGPVERTVFLEQSMTSGLNHDGDEVSGPSVAAARWVPPPAAL